MTATLLVFSRLRWDDMFQRPQHLLIRLARQFPVLFVEEPVHHAGAPFMRTTTPVADVLVCQPRMPLSGPQRDDAQLSCLRTLVQELAREHPEHIAWLCTPTALPLLAALDARMVVADCMKAFDAGSATSPSLQTHADALLQAADLVLTNSPGRLRAWRALHPNVQCLPGGVDTRHFAPAFDRANSHPLHRDIPGPRLGYCGVIDERIDAELIRALADAHPRWQIVLVGPVTRIDPMRLPRRPNIHYLGPQPHAELPRFLAGWDVCLLPFARNAFTDGMCPGKTLEYMAAELPIVCTPLPDVVERYGEVVTVAQDAPSFVAACERALLASPQEREHLVAKTRALLDTVSWDACAARVATLLRTAPRARQRLPVAEGVSVLTPDSGSATCAAA